MELDEIRIICLNLMFICSGVLCHFMSVFFLGAVVIEIVGGSRAVRSFDEKEIIESLCYSVIVSLLLSGIEYVL